MLAGVWLTVLQTGRPQRGGWGELGCEMHSRCEVSGSTVDFCGRLGQHHLQAAVTRGGRCCGSGASCVGHNCTAVLSVSENGRTLRREKEVPSLAGGHEWRTGAPPTQQGWQENYFPAWAGPSQRAPFPRRTHHSPPVGRSRAELEKKKGPEQEEREREREEERGSPQTRRRVGDFLCFFSSSFSFPFSLFLFASRELGGSGGLLAPGRRK